MSTMTSRRNYRQRLNIVAAFVVACVLLFVFRDSVFPTPTRIPAAQEVAAPVDEDGEKIIQKPGDEDVEMVIASMKRENVTWLNDYLLEWKKNIYVVDDPEAELTVRVNKGREAMVFLT